MAGVDERDHDRGVGGTAAAVGVDDAAGEIDFFEEVVLIGGDEDAATIIDEGVVGKCPSARVSE